MNTIIEKIRAEVERLWNEHPTEDIWDRGYNYACEEIMSFLYDLEKEEKPTTQEQPVKTNIVEDLKHYLATTPKEQIEKDWESLKEWGKVGPSVSEFLGCEQPVCEGLEEEIQKYMSERWEFGCINPTTPVYLYDFTTDELKECARHFAKWGAEHAREQMMIQWTGNNLKDLIEFTGKSPRFNEWFKSWDDYEDYVRQHGNIFKMFNDDGSHLEVPVGAWIVKTPDRIPV